MDTLTHALSGALLARATAPRSGTPGAISTRARVAAGLAAATFPDLDVLASVLSPLTYLYQHRGVTHSLLLLPLWALLLAWCASRIDPGRPSWKAYYGVMALGLGIHIWGDLITAFGTMIWAPVSDARVAWGTTFIIDLWFSGIILLGLAASARWRDTARPARIAVIVLAGYVGMQWLWQQQALEVGRAHAISAGLSGARVTALPRPPLPTHWMVLVEQGGRTDYAFVSLARRAPPAQPAPGAGFFTRLAAPYLPAGAAVWVSVPRYGGVADEAFARAAWASEPFAFFRWFSAHPVLYRRDVRDGADCAWFQDLRFFTPGREAWPFRYGACREGGRWLAYEWIDAERRTAVY